MDPNPKAITVDQFKHVKDFQSGCHELAQCYNMRGNSVCLLYFATKMIYTVIINGQAVYKDIYLDKAVKAYNNSLFHP